MRLASVPRINAILVEADLAAVLDYIRGEATSALQRYDQDPEPGAWNVRPAIQELHGAAAQIDRAFGPEAAYFGQFPSHACLTETFPLRGWRRVSRLRCNPRFVLYEEALDHVRLQMEMNLQHWTGGNTYAILSQIAPYPVDPEHARVLLMPDAPGSHAFTALDADRMRRVAYLTNERRRFFARGDPWPFEDSYEGLKPKERLTRDRLCTYLERLGIDPEAVFERRELDAPVLFTEDHPGRPATIYPDAATRYEQTLENGWIGKVFDGRWF